MMGMFFSAGWPQKHPMEGMMHVMPTPATYKPRKEAMEAAFASYRAQQPSAFKPWSGRWRYLQPRWWWWAGPTDAYDGTRLYHIRGQWWLHHEHAKKWERVP